MTRCGGTRSRSSSRRLRKVGGVCRGGWSCERFRFQTTLQNILYLLTGRRTLKDRHRRANDAVGSIVVGWWWPPPMRPPLLHLAAAAAAAEEALPTARRHRHRSCGPWRCAACGGPVSPRASVLRRDGGGGDGGDADEDDSASTCASSLFSSLQGGEEAGFARLGRPQAPSRLRFRPFCVRAQPGRCDGRMISSSSIPTDVGLPRLQRSCLPDGPRSRRRLCLTRLP